MCKRISVGKRCSACLTMHLSHCNIFSQASTALLYASGAYQISCRSPEQHDSTASTVRSDQSDAASHMRHGEVTDEAKCVLRKGCATLAAQRIRSQGLVPLQGA